MLSLLIIVDYVPYLRTVLQSYILTAIIVIMEVMMLEPTLH
jgi:hypothetical protein